MIDEQKRWGNGKLWRGIMQKAELKQKMGRIICALFSSCRIILIASFSSHHSHRIILIASFSSHHSHRIILIASFSSHHSHRIILSHGATAIELDYGRRIGGEYQPTMMEPERLKNAG
jgi:hypothetical protein